MNTSVQYSFIFNAANSNFDASSKPMQLPTAVPASKKENRHIEEADTHLQTQGSECIDDLQILRASHFAETRIGIISRQRQSLINENKPLDWSDITSLIYLESDLVGFFAQSCTPVRSMIYRFMQHAHGKERNRRVTFVDPHTCGRHHVLDSYAYPLAGHELVHDDSEHMYAQLMAMMKSGNHALIAVDLRLSCFQRFSTRQLRRLRRCARQMSVMLCLIMRPAEKRSSICSLNARIIEGDQSSWAIRIERHPVSHPQIIPLPAY